MNIRVTIWNEFIHENEAGSVGDCIRSFYPNGIHEYLRGTLGAEDPGLEIRAVSLNEPDQGLPPDVLDSTDVLVWWGHCAHDRVDDALVNRIQNRIQRGMGLIALHSAHFSKIFRRMMGTSCRLHWREVGEKERLWCVAPGHPIAAGVPETFVLPHSEMYGERFDVPDDGKIVFMSWFEGGNVFRSGLAFERDRGRIFYFSPGHELYPVYHEPVIRRILRNAIHWAAPVNGIVPDRITPQPEPLEIVRTENPAASLDTAALHRTQA